MSHLRTSLAAIAWLAVVPAVGTARDASIVKLHFLGCEPPLKMIMVTAGTQKWRIPPPEVSGVWTYDLGQVPGAVAIDTENTKLIIQEIKGFSIEPAAKGEWRAGNAHYTFKCEKLVSLKILGVPEPRGLDVEYELFGEDLRSQGKWDASTVIPITGIRKNSWIYLQVPLPDCRPFRQNISVASLMKRGEPKEVDFAAALANCQAPKSLAVGAKQATGPAISLEREKHRNTTGDEFTGILISIDE